MLDTATRPRWTTADMERLPDNGMRYELIDGELIMVRAPHWNHQMVSLSIAMELTTWARSSGHGQVTTTPGVLFSDTDNVIPDVVWVSHERLAALLDAGGHLTGAPELVIEVLSEGAQHEQRDRVTKRRLYSDQGVQEYWIVDWRRQTVKIYRHDGATLAHSATLTADDAMTSPLLPGFACAVARFFW